MQTSHPAVFVVFCFCVLLLGSARAGSEAHILLQDSPLAGFQYHRGKAVWPDMKVGDRLNLAREPSNRYDARAIRVEWRGQKLGYVPRRENDDIARLMDNGAKLEARIIRLTESRDPWQRVRFEIILPLE
jgi:hypothetical protein